MSTKITKRQAKARAYILAASWIDDAVGMGYESIHADFTVDENDDFGDMLPEHESLKVIQALQEVADSLYERGRKMDG